MMKQAGVTPHGPNDGGRRNREVGTTWCGHQLVQLRLQPRDLLAQLNVVHPAQRKHKRVFSAADMPTLRTLDALLGKHGTKRASIGIDSGLDEANSHLIGQSEGLPARHFTLCDALLLS